MKTTLNKIREHSPCAERWEKLLKNLGKTKADDDEVSIKTILESNGIADAVWCLRAVDGYDKEIRLYAVWCARQVQHLMKDPRSLESLDVAEAFTNGKATAAELKAAWEASVRAAEAAVGAAAWAAAGAAWAAADAAAWAAAGAAGAASAAAWKAAWEAAVGAAAWAAADAAAWEAQEQELLRILNDIEKGME